VLSARDASRAVEDDGLDPDKIIIAEPAPGFFGECREGGGPACFGECRAALESRWARDSDG
jgi:hypothetical protein